MHDDRLSKEEVISDTGFTLQMDAHEAPKNLITNGIYALLKNPES